MMGPHVHQVYGAKFLCLQLLHPSPCFPRLGDRLSFQHHGQRSARWDLVAMETSRLLTRAHAECACYSTPRHTPTIRHCLRTRSMRLVNDRNKGEIYLLISIAHGLIIYIWWICRRVNEGAQKWVKDADRNGRGWDRMRQRSCTRTSNHNAVMACQRGRAWELPVCRSLQRAWFLHRCPDECPCWYNRSMLSDTAAAGLPFSVTRTARINETMETENSRRLQLQAFSTSGRCSLQHWEEGCGSVLSRTLSSAGFEQCHSQTHKDFSIWKDQHCKLRKI